MIEPYEELLELAQRQQELIGDADWVGAVTLSDRWDELTETLPEEPPYEARPLLEEAAAIVISNIGVLEAAIHSTAHQLGHIARGRHALDSYVSGLGAAGLDARG